MSQAYTCHSEIVQRILKFDPEEREFGDFTPGRFAWLSDSDCSVEFDEMIPERGRQGFWQFPIDRLPKPHLYTYADVSP